jgi:hypothetical protein
MSAVEWHEDGERELLNSRGLRQKLDAVAFTITAHAVPHSGVDTGRLINSMGHTVKTDNGQLVAYLGSGLQDGTQPVFYWSYHWAGRAAPNQESLPKSTDSLPKREHPTRPGPTRPYSKALRELGINAHINPGGFES